jgi:uncharacterized protein
MTSPKMTFINLPVADLPKTIGFYTALGFSFNPQFTDDSATCMIINETTCAMLMVRDRFMGFTAAPIPDAKTTTGMMIALALDDRAAVDEFAKTALAHGGGEPRPATDMGFMYNRTISDLDGHRWEPFYMDMAAMPKA